MSGYEQYTWLDLLLQTNAEYFYHIFPMWGSRNEETGIDTRITQGHAVTYMHCAITASGQLSSYMNILGGNNMLSIRTTTNNANWILGIIRIYGVKIL